jgi:hypothetical protein
LKQKTLRSWICLTASGHKPEQSFNRPSLSCNKTPASFAYFSELTIHFSAPLKACPTPPESYTLSVTAEIPKKTAAALINRQNGPAISLQTPTWPRSSERIFDDQNRGQSFESFTSIRMKTGKGKVRGWRKRKSMDDAYTASLLSKMPVETCRILHAAETLHNRLIK